MKTKKSWLNNKTVLLTGASSGIGRELSKVLVNTYGCRVIGTARREDKLKFLRDELGNNFDYRVCDVSKLSNWQDLKSGLDSNNISIDVLINNAGTIHEFDKFINIDLDKIDQVVNTNFYSIIYSLKTFLPDIISRKGGVLNISSAAGLVSIPGMSIYGATKAGIYNLSLALSREVPKGVYVGVVCPGFIRTELFDAKNGNNEVIKSKDRKLVNHFSMSSIRAAKKIARRLHRRKVRSTLGRDAKLLSGYSRLCPYGATRIMSNLMKITNLESFENINKK